MVWGQQAPFRVPKVSKDRLTELASYAVPSVLACTVVPENIPDHLGKCESVNEFSIGKKNNVGGDLAAVDFESKSTRK